MRLGGERSRRGRLPQHLDLGRPIELLWIDRDIHFDLREFPYDAVVGIDG